MPRKTKKETTTKEISIKIPRIMSDMDLLKFLKVDTREWEIVKVVYGKSEGYRKDRQVSWDVKQGKVTSGKVRDSGKLLIEPLFSVKVYMRRKVEEIKVRNDLTTLLSEVKLYSPKYKKIKHPRQTTGFLYELAMPDLQLGRLVMAEEAGLASCPESYLLRTERAIQQLLSVPYQINRILFPIGNDFFNSNTSENMTVHGTPQRDDVRWQRTYQLAKKTIIGLIETMTTLAPVDILIVKGNHDEERIFYFGDTIESWFHNNPNVKVDNRPIGRKYYSYGKVLLGLTHGYHERVVKLKDILYLEARGMLDQAQYIEWHTGDKHHKEDFVLKTNETENGIVIRLLRSLTSPDAWHYNKGLNGALRAAESFLWDKDHGLKAQFTAIP